MTAAPDVDDDPAVATTSDDGLYACARPGAEVEVTLRAGFTAFELATAYLGLTCANVFMPIDLAERSHTEAFQGRLAPAEIEPRFRALFAEMGLALVRERGLSVVVEQSALARRPGMLLLMRTPPEAARLVAPRPPSPPPVQLEGITRVDDTLAIVTRVAANGAIAAGDARARLLASVKNGQPNGVKLYAIRPSSVYAAIGLQNGDTVHTLNGAPLREPADVTFDKLFAASRVELAITRRGKPLTLRIEIRD